ncbi:ERF family protein [Micromonospora aurantiaca]|uniref:ERF family protein n=1 Tax=Micromonospora aurantiaca (nom. illeg.) TaxID=47850 RepID=UPI0033A4D1B0
MADPKTLDEALAIFQANPPTLVKDKRGQVGNQKTKYADLVQVNAVVLSELNKLGVVYKTKPTLRAEDPKFVLAYQLTHVASGTSEAGEYPLKLAENPMAMGSAITYARRYVLLALTGVAAEDEDDDGQSASGRYAQRAEQRQRAAAPTEGGQTAQRAARPAAASRAAQPPLPGEQPAGPSVSQMGMLMGLFGKVGLKEREARLRTASTLVGRPLESAKDLTRAETSDLINVLLSASESDDPAGVLAEAMAAAQAAGEGQ